MSIKFLHCADIHLGTKSEFGGTEVRRYIAESFQRLVGLAIDEGTDLFIVAGDLFDSPRISPATSNLVDRALSDLTSAGVRVVLLPGTHDAYDSSSPYHQLKLPENTYIITPQNPSFLFDDLPGGVFVCGRAQTKTKSNENALEGLSPNPQTALNIAVAHGSVVGQVTEDAMLIHTEDIARSGFDYIALGHWHSYREISQKPPAIYPGALEPTRRDQRDTGWVVVGEFSLENKKLTYRKEQVGSLRVESFPLHIEPLSEEEKIYSLITERADRNLILIIELSGSPKADFQLNWDELKDELASQFFHLEITDHTKPFEELSPADFGEHTIAGVFAPLVGERTEKASNDQERVFLDEVLKEGLSRLSRGGEE